MKNVRHDIENLQEDMKNRKKGTKNVRKRIILILVSQNDS